MHVYCFLFLRGAEACVLLLFMEVFVGWRRNAYGISPYMIYSEFMLLLCATWEFLAIHCFLAGEVSSPTLLIMIFFNSPVEDVGGLVFSKRRGRACIVRLVMYRAARLYMFAHDVS